MSVDQRLARRGSVREARAEAESGSGLYAAIARTGLVAKGVSYAIVGGLAIALAAGAGGKATSREGALHTLAGNTLGGIALVLLALGFAAYALWRIVQAFAEREDSDEDEKKAAAKKWGKRAGYIGRAVIYGSLAYSAVKLLLGDEQSESQSEKAHKTTATVLSWPAGTWLVAIAGIVIFGVGLWNLYRAITRNFEEKWRTGEMGSDARRWGGRAGFVGHLARAIVFGMIGVFVFKAAVEYDPKEAVGIDGALQKLAAASYGPFLLGLTAAGLVAYAVYCFVDARYRDVSANQ